MLVNKSWHIPMIPSLVELQHYDNGNRNMRVKTHFSDWIFASGNVTFLDIEYNGLWEPGWLGFRLKPLIFYTS